MKNTSMIKRSYNEMAWYNGMSPDNVAEKDIPVTVKNCITSLSSLETKINTAVTKAGNAKQKANAAGAVELKWYKIGDKAKAIEALQDAVKDMAAAQGDQACALEEILTYQRHMATAMQFLFGLGAMSLTANRNVVQSIRAQLEGASEEELSAMARAELNATIAQLKAQEDLQVKQEKTIAVVKSNRSRLDDKDKVDAEQSAELVRLAEADRSLEAKAELNSRGVAEVREMHGKLAEEFRRADDEQDAEIQRQAEKDKDLDQKTEQNKQRIADNAREIEHNAQLINELEERLKIQRHAIAQNRARMGRGRAPIVISLIALAISIATAGYALYRLGMASGL